MPLKAAKNLENHVLARQIPADLLPVTHRLQKINKQRPGPFGISTMISRIPHQIIACLVILSVVTGGCVLPQIKERRKKLRAAPYMEGNILIIKPYAVYNTKALDRNELTNQSKNKATKGSAIVLWRRA
jgi:hypothetical protein